MPDAHLDDDAISRAIARAAAKALPVMAANFIHPAWAMSASEFRAFWGRTRLAAIGTVGSSPWPHAAPIEISLVGDRFSAPTFADSVRARDMAVNPRVAIVTWEDAWHAAIVYGKVEASSSARAGVVSIVPSRIYAIRAPVWHHATRLPAG